MANSANVYFETDQTFDEENRADRGNLKKRAMRALALKIKDAGFDSLMEVRDPSIAHACFRMLKTDNRWTMKRVKA